MKINKVTLKNFKSYYLDENEYDFSTSEDKNVVLVIAEAGYGKTSLMEAIKWTLYDKKYIDSLNKGKSKEEWRGRKKRKKDKHHHKRMNKQQKNSAKRQQRRTLQLGNQKPETQKHTEKAGK